MNKLYLIKLDNGSKLEVCADDALNIQLHEQYVFKRDYINDIGEVLQQARQAGANEDLSLCPTILRKADMDDLREQNLLFPKARRAMTIAKQAVERLKLEMKLLNAHYTLDGKQITIQFSAEGRVDFRELVKELSHELCTRIELRQIGVRDETGVYGGIAVCGQPLCCARFLHDFASINVKMAKDQDLALTPSSISGACGRLKCCLKYEHEGYLEMEKTMPRRGEWCDTPAGRGRITDRNLLLQKVSVSFESGNVQQFDRSEITILPPEKRPVPNNQNRNGAQGSNNPRRERPPKNNRPKNANASAAGNNHKDAATDAK